MVDRRVVIVTGGTYGIGRAVTLALARRGYAVVAFGLEARQIGSVAANGVAGTRAALEREGLAADLLEADVSQAEAVQRVVDFTLQKYGRIDALVNNAAIHPSGTILETSEEVWDRVIAVNLKGMFLCTRAVIAQMVQQGGGAIVNVGSGAGWGKPNLLAYSASKGGVFALSAALAHDHLPDHIRVNVVVPGGGVLTGMTEGMPYLQRAAQQTVAGRNPLPEDIAAAVAYLLSEEAEMVSGAVLTVGCFTGQGGSVMARPAGAGDSASS
jgi:NAD(P)-dependent dehydrogenase (short-subunit alcohol dehydrogenase family)